MRLAKSLKPHARSASEIDHSDRRRWRLSERGAGFPSVLSFAPKKENGAAEQAVCSRPAPHK